MTCALAIIILAYLIGSIPTGYLLGRLVGIDIRTRGSGNIGATNVFRTLGPWLGILVFAGDVAKGWYAVRAAFWLNSHFPSSLLELQGLYVESGPVLPAVVAAILGAIWAMIGHTFTVWLDFKGGKGVATALGTLIALVPLAAGIGFGVWVAVFVVTRYVSVASLAGVAATPVAVFFTVPVPDRWPLLGLSILLAVLIFLRHRENIERLRRGTEHRFGQRRHD